MTRTQIHLTDEQRKKIKEEVDRTGLKQSEVIRRVVDKGLVPDYYKDAMELIPPPFVPGKMDKPDYIYLFTVLATVNIFKCMAHTIDDPEDKIKMALDRQGPYKHYTKENPLLLGDMKANQNISLWVKGIDPVKRYGGIKVEGGVPI